MVDPVQHAIEELEAARRKMIESVDGLDKHGPFKDHSLLEEADDHILGVLDQLTGFCGPRMKLGSYYVNPGDKRLGT